MTINLISFNIWPASSKTFKFVQKLVEFSDINERRKLNFVTTAMVMYHILTALIYSQENVWCTGVVSSKENLIATATSVNTNVHF